MLAAASSLRHVLPPLLDTFRADRGGPEIQVTYSASGVLRRQVEGGAPVDGVLFASAAPVDELVAKGALLAESRQVVARNQLVLVGQPGHTLTFATLGEVPLSEKIAMGDPGSVPAGQYARELLETMGLWNRLRGRLVFGGDVAAVLAYARRREVAGAIVYRTEVRGLDDVAILDAALLPRPEVVVAAVPHAAPIVREFLRFLGSPAAAVLFARYGFAPP